MRNRLLYYNRIQKSIDYIEENLHHVITLEDLASQAYFSIFHFHRIFRNLVGDTVMDYIRKRRLQSAAYDLINSNKRILDIALECQFNSQDTFDRAFKREFGITPGHYRRLKKQFIYPQKWEKPKEENPMFDQNISSRLQCSVEEKKECLELLFTIVTLAQKTHKEGLLSLENDINDSLPFLLRKGLKYILDGTEPSLVLEMLSGYLTAGDYHGKEFLIRWIIIKGVLSIQAGEYPRVIIEKLGAYFGEDFAVMIDQRFQANKIEQEKEIQEYLQNISNNSVLNLQTTLLEEPITKLDQRSCQRALREIELVELACALQGVSGKTFLKIFNNLSKDVQSMLFDELEVFRGIENKEIISSQRKILEIMQRLREENEIR